MAKTNAERQQEHREQVKAVESEALDGLMAQVKIRAEDGTYAISMGPGAVEYMEVLAHAQDSTVSEILRTAIAGQMRLAVRTRQTAQGEVRRFLVV